MSAAELFVAALALVFMLALAGTGLWAVHTRRKYWEQYEAEREARKVTSNADDFGGFPG